MWMMEVEKSSSFIMALQSFIISRCISFVVQFIAELGAVLLLMNYDKDSSFNYHAEEIQFWYVGMPIVRD